MTNESQSASASQDVEGGRTMTETAYRAIRGELLSGFLAPGSKLRIDELRRRLNIGASPIREALSRLISEGLVTTEEQKGFRAAPMSAREFAEITELRILLELEAVRKAIENGKEEWESGIVAAHHLLAHSEARIGKGGSTDDFEIRNRDFHNAIVSACDSVWIMRLRDVLHGHSQRYRYRSLAAGPTPRNTAKEHRLIRDAVLARDTEKSCTLIRRHFQLTLEYYMKQDAYGSHRLKI